MKKISFLLLLPLVVLALGACSSAKEKLGLERKPPDEFAVVKRAPLAMPPSYSLRPPSPGAPRPQEQTPNQQAQTTIFGGQTTTTNRTASSGEALLVQKAGAAAVDPNIRQKVDTETTQLHDRNKPVAEKLFGIGGDADTESATVVDAKQEAERLRKNIKEGKPVTEGETPSIEE